MQGLRRVIDGYDTGIAYADAQLGRVFDLLREQGIYDEVNIIVTSDHGENLGELGLYSEHATADHPTCRIPMLIKWQGAQRGAVDRGLHYSLDLCPTVAELLQVEMMLYVIFVLQVEVLAFSNSRHVLEGLKQL